MTHALQRIGLLTFAVAVAWASYMAYGTRTAQWIAGRFSQPLGRMSDGKFDDPVTFIHGRMGEAFLLGTLGLVICLCLMEFWRWMSEKKIWNRGRGILMGVVIFSSINGYAWAAGNTVLFWGLFYDSVNIDNFVQYQIKKLLLKESNNRQRIVLMGNSQANRSIDEVMINRTLGNRLWVTELTQPGTRGFDLLTLSRDIPFKGGDRIICYISEISFYGGGSGIVAADFLNFSEMLTIFQLKGANQFEPGSVQSGLVGRLCPLYRFRKPVSARLLGWKIANIDQTIFDQNYQPNLEHQAKEWALKLKVGELSRFHLAGMSEMLAEVSKKGCKVFLLTGHTHPALRYQINPEVTQNFNNFLKSQAMQYPGQVIYLDAQQIYEPVESDFTDLVHLNDKGQEKFTNRLISYLKDECK